MNEKILIDNLYLTPTMERIRSGATQLFREKDKNNRTFVSIENCDVSLQHENKEMYAKLIDNKWYWVSGCSECLGKERNWITYIECDKHNICSKCSISRKENKGACWGNRSGWICNDCHESKKADIRREAFERFNQDELEDYDFHYMDKIKCPHCGSDISSDDIHESQELECEVCEGVIELEVEYTASYSTSIKGVRVIK